MKTKHIIIVCAVVLVALSGLFAFPYLRLHYEWNSTVEALQDLPRDRIIAAVQAFAHDRQAASNSVPREVTLDELVAGGYLKAGEVVAFRGRTVKVLTAVDSSTPGLILLLAHLTDDHYLAEMTDGSTMMFRKR